MDLLQYFYPVLFVVAFLYASVGHGGASGYLAIMAIFSFSPEVMRPSALVLNIFVAGLAFYQYARRGHFRRDLFWPFAAASIPASFLGGTLDLDPLHYRQILGVFLLLAVSRLIWKRKKEGAVLRPVQIPLALLAGAAIGLFSGLIGVGGGIILSPVLLLLHWADMKQTAAVSALFIFLNSVAGLSGVLVGGGVFDERIPWMILIAFSGGLLGSYLGANRVSAVALRMLLAVVLLVAAGKLILMT